MYGTVLAVGDFNRKLILVIGSFPIDTNPFKERNLLVEYASLDTASNYFKDCRAIIIVDYPSKYDLIKKCLKKLIPDIINHGIALRIIGHNNHDFNSIEAILSGASVSSINFYFINKINELAENIARYSPGPFVNVNLEINGKDESKIDNEAKLLLRRSFYDCSKIHVELISGGRDAKYLLKVHAWQRNSIIESSLMPFFVKISSPEKIVKELNNYRVFTDLHISFQYRPNCRIERCVYTKTYKSLVGNFVEDAIPLRSALRDMHHKGVIFSLFEKSLMGFRRQPILDKEQGTLRTFLVERIKIDELVQNNEVINKAREFGLQSDVNQMYDRLLSICPESSLMCIIHGDLHCGNVMVMDNDAILIDFSAVKEYRPLTVDPATLDISLSFNLDEKKPPEFEKWKDFIDEAYAPNQVARPLTLSEPVPNDTESVPNEFFWLRRSIRQIRHILIGCDPSKDEIEVIIACHLVRIARLTPKESKGERGEFEFKCHAYALVVAERIINSVFERNQVKS